MSKNIHAVKRACIERFSRRYARKLVEDVTDLACPEVERADASQPRGKEARRIRGAVEADYERRYGVIDPLTLSLILRVILWLLGQWFNDDETANAADDTTD